MKKTRMAWVGIALVLAINFTLHAQTTVESASASDLSTMLEAVEQTTPEPATNAPFAGNFYSAQHAPGTENEWPPLPGNVNHAPVWSLGGDVFLLSDLDYNYDAPLPAKTFRRSSLSALDLSPPDDGDDDTNSVEMMSFLSTPIATNGLWLQITNVSNGLAYLNLMKGTDYVYEIFSKTDLTATNWNIENEVFPGINTNVMPFTVSQLNRTNLFLWARDWTGVNTNGLPAWWWWKWFGNFYEASNNVDADGNTLQFDYLHGFDPSHVLFSLEFTNQYVNTSTTYGAVSVYGGYPYYMTILVNDPDTNDAVWLPFTSTNVPVYFNNGSGTYTIGVGLKGFAPNAQPQWQWDTLICTDTGATPWNLMVTNPVSGNVSVPLIQLQGLVNRTLSQLTYDVSNALGVITNQSGYWKAAFYDTNLLAFTTNAFQCYDLRLTNGLNTITLHATDREGNVVTTNLSYTLSYAGVTNMPEISIIWPKSTPVGGSNVTVQAQTDDATASFSASANGSSIQGLVERNGTVWLQNVPLDAGTNVITITVTNAAGNVSTTNLTIVQSSVSLTVNPISSDQLNQSLVSLTGTVSDPSQNVWVNGVHATVNGSGNWAATNVPVNNVNLAELHLQAGATTNNIQAELISDEAQPPTVTMLAYTKTYHEIDWFYNSWCLDRGPTIPYDLTMYWTSGKGQMHYHTIYWNGDNCPVPPVSEDGTTDLSGYINDLPVPWLNANNSSVFENGVWSVKLNVETKLAIQPSGQQQTGAMETYLVLVSALEYAVTNIYNIEYLNLGELNNVTHTPIPPAQITVSGQSALNTGIMNTNGTTWGLTSVIAPVGTVAPLVPGATLSNPNDAPVFQMQVYQLVSQCVATTPSDRSRTNLGVGEQVNLYFNPALPTTNVTWSTTAGGLAVTSGMTNLFTAPSNAANVTVTVTIGSAPVNFYFKVFAPTGICYVKNRLYHTYDEADVGFNVWLYVQPDFVNFGAVQCQEEQAYAVADGVYSEYNGSGHQPYTEIDFGTIVVPGLGTGGIGGANDTCYSGVTDPLLHIPYTNGTETISIPWDFRVGENGTWKTNFTTLTWHCSKSDGGDHNDGLLNASKSNANVQMNVDDPSAGTP